MRTDSEENETIQPSSDGERFAVGLTVLRNGVRLGRHVCMRGDDPLNGLQAASHLSVGYPDVWHSAEGAGVGAIQARVNTPRAPL